jgi:iron complex outermembrane recepter protein
MNFKLSTILMSAVSLIAIGSTAHAQAPQADAAAVEEVVVTGSRIVRNGFQAPTPVTVATTEALERAAPTSIPDGLNQLPQFTGSSSAQAPGNAATRPAAGNYLNLRGIGEVRNLILLDGQRVPPTSFNGTVDTNIIPQMLVQRVDIVTGGASAAYGSDAVSGVVNFVLDTRFNGLKGVVQGGISDYGDDRSGKIGLAWGKQITDRLHVLLSGEHYERQGIPSIEDRPRGDENCVTAASGNGTAAVPRRVYCNASYVTATHGTLLTFPTQVNITGQGNNNRWHFLPNGTVDFFDTGLPTGNPAYFYNGEGAPITGKALTAKIITDQLFGRFDYEISDNMNAFAQLTWAESFNRYNTVGAGTQLGDFRVFSDNAYLPTSVQNAIAASGQTLAGTSPAQRFVTGGRIGDDLDYKWVNTLNNVYTFLGGFNGKIGDYSWKATYSHGDSLVRLSHFGNLINRNWYSALDAVRNTRGEIVCRITVTNPGLQDDCIPINIFGDGAVTKAQNDYVMGTSQYQIRNKMDVVAGEVSGELFTLPAGAVAFAVGAEARKQSLEQDTNSDPATPVSVTGLRTNVNTYLNRTASTNQGRASGEYSVKEVFGEVDVPLLRDAPMAYALSVNGAARYTDYSTSGGVTTWKVGVSYSPIQDLRLRYTRSRDIRAPTLYELFAGDTAGRGPFNDIKTGLNQTAISLSSGNPNLTPEEANTYTLGLVYQPSWIEGLTMSVDYYNIEINDAISNIAAATSNQECENSNGTSPLCANIVRPAGVPFSDRTVANFPLSVRSVPINQAEAYFHGIDFEMAYRMPLDRFFESTDAVMDFRLIGSYNGTRKTKSSAGAAPVQAANVGVNPDTRVNLVVNYMNGPLSVNTQLRYIGPTRRTAERNIWFADNSIEAVGYVDTTISYKFQVAEKDLEAFLTINNLLDKTAPFVPSTGQPGIDYPTVQGLFDVVGRYYTTGLRFKF